MFLENAGYIFFFLILLIGTMLAPIGLKGVWIIFIATLIFALITHFNQITVGILIILFILALISEQSDYLFNHLGIRKLGASKLSAIISVLCSIIGAILYTITTLNIVFAVFFSYCFGFLGAFITEIIRKSRLKDASIMELGSIIGLSAATFFKVIIAVTMLLIIIFNIF